MPTPAPESARLTDAECIGLLQWALPQLGLRWQGFRRVRTQVCKRLRRRLTALGLQGAAAYREHLTAHPAEWALLDTLCHITISRFYRDRAVFEALRRVVLPALAAGAQATGQPLRAWSAGCASGEEAYSLALVWGLDVAARFPDLALELVATDADPALLVRARRGCYRASSLRELPDAWHETAFVRRNDEVCLRAAFRHGIRFATQDIRRTMPAGLFHLILCRNLVFTYFEPALQAQVLACLRAHLAAGGALVLGSHERLPADCIGFAPWNGAPHIYRRNSG